MTHNASGRGRRFAALSCSAALVLGLASSCAPVGTEEHGRERATAPAVRALPASVPDRITIPDIDVDADLSTVGLDADGMMRTPPFDRPEQAAWYRQGPTPGEQGTAAIVGHKDTPETSTAVFHQLKELRKNQEIQVHRRDGSTAIFQVDAVDTFRKDEFPTQRVYGRTGRAELRLITCGGELTNGRHWDSNVIVFAHLTGPPHG